MYLRDYRGGAPIWVGEESERYASSLIQVLPWGREEAQTYGSLRAKQEMAGKPLGNLDMLIAAHAISVGAILVTNDRAFSHVPGLPATANWATEL